MSNGFRVFAAVIPLLLARGGWAAPRACVGSTPVGSFRITVSPEQGAAGRPIRQVNILQPGYRLRYEPLKFPATVEKQARVAIALIPVDNSDIEVLDPQPALEAAVWIVPKRASVVAVVFGPSGLDAGKVDKLAEKQPDLLPQLADYAEQTAQVEALVETLAAWEQVPGGNSRNLDAALTGFSSQYGVNLPKLDPKAPTDQQASLLLRGLLPALSTYDPLAGQRSTFMQQSAGLAANVASMFFGSPVGLAAGGAAMFQNTRTLLFPNTELRSTIAQSQPDGVSLCAKPQAAKARTRLAYLWAVRIPNAAAPSVSLAESPYIPAAFSSPVRFKPEKLLARATDWRLVPVGSGSPVPVPVAFGPGADTLTLDLTRATVPAGEYSLAAKWDWDDMPVVGTVHVAPFADLASAHLSPESQDRLVEGAGTVSLKLEGPDFQFVEKAWLVKPGLRGPSVQDLSFVLPSGPRAGEQRSLEVDLDVRSLTRGKYALRLAQSDGKKYEVPISVLPPDPRVGRLRANLGETGQALALEGAGLERLVSLESEAADFELAPTRDSDAQSRGVTVRLKQGMEAGRSYALRARVQGVNRTLEFPRALEIAGPRPKFVSVKVSFAEAGGIALRPDEIPSGSTVSLAVAAQNLDAAPVLDLSCEGQTGKLTLRPGDRSSKARLDLAGENLLFLSLDPAAVGQSGCKLFATITTDSAGRSERYHFGRITRMPRIDRFTLSDESLGNNMYAGLLIGQDLETIDRTGWNAKNGVPVMSIPTPLSGEPGKQSLKIAMPWPAPAPRAPVYVWLRGESEGRATSARF